MFPSLCKPLGIRSKKLQLLREAERMEASMFEGVANGALQPVDCPLFEGFTPGCYLREVFMPAGTIVLGHQHKTEHWNIVTQGRCSVLMDGVISEFKAGDRFVSKPGVRKALRIHEDCKWITIHPTDETDKEKLEELLIVKSETFLLNQDQKRLESHD